MSKAYIHRPTFGPFKGIDLSVDKLNLPAGHNSSALNVLIPRGSTAVQTRPGISRTGDKRGTIGADLPGWGLFPYQSTDSTTGEIIERLLSLDVQNGEFFELLTRDFIITSDFANHTASLYVSPTDGRRYFSVTYTPLNSVRFNLALDDVDHVPTVTISQLVAAINADIDLINLDVSAALGTALGSEFAADFLPLMSDVFLNTIGTSIEGRVWDEVRTAAGVSDIIFEYLTSLGNAEDEIPTFTNIQGCLFIALGAGQPILKFDGACMYVAGIAPPSGNSGTVTAAGAGTVPSGTFTYLVSYEHRDAKRNRIEGLCYSKPTVDASNPALVVLAPSKVTLAGAGGMEVAVDRLGISGYQVNGAKVDTDFAIQLNQSVHTCAVFTGHTMEVGDKAVFLFKRIIVVGAATTETLILGSAFVTATTATGITLGTSWDLTYLTPGYSALDNITPVGRFHEETDVSGSKICPPATNILNEAYFVGNSYISNGLVANLYRIKGEGLSAGAVTDWSRTYYLLDIVPHPFEASYEYQDVSLNDDDLGPALIQKIDFAGQAWPESYSYSLPKGRYVSAISDRLYVAGIKNSPDVVDRSDVLYGAEWVDPRGLSQLSMDFGAGDKISGLRGGDDFVIVGKTESVVIIEGDLSSESSVSVRVLSSEVNCLSHASMKNLVGGVVFCSRLGPMMYAPGAGLSFLGKSAVTGKSKLDGAFASSAAIDGRRICAEIDPDRGLYLIYVPNAVNGTQDGEEEAFLGLKAYTTATGIDQTGAIYAYDVLNQSWFKWTGIDPNGGICRFDGDIFFSRVGFDRDFDPAFGIYESRTFVLNNSESAYDFVDWYSAINVEVGTPWDMLGDPFHLKSYQRAGVLCVEPTVPSQLLTITTYANYNDSLSSRNSLSLSSTKRRGAIKLKTATVLALRAVISASIINQRTILNGIELEASAQFRPKLGVPNP